MTDSLEKQTVFVRHASATYVAGGGNRRWIKITKKSNISAGSIIVSSAEINSNAYDVL
jgi:hypothetical protein